MKKIFARIRVFFKELGNILTNFIVPFVSLLIAILEILPIPTIWIKFLKTVEYWLFYASGTAKDIEKIVEDKEKDLK